MAKAWVEEKQGRFIQMKPKHKGLKEMDHKESKLGKESRGETQGTG